MSCECIKVKIIDNALKVNLPNDVLSVAFLGSQWPQWIQWEQWIQGDQGIQWLQGLQWEQWIQGEQWLQWDSYPETFETVSKNLSTRWYTLNYTSWDLTSIIYTDWTDTITKTFNYTSWSLTSIVLSWDTPSGIDLTKTLSYTGGDLTSITYT